MAGNQTVNTDLTKLNKKDLLKMYIYSQAFVSGFNYEKQEAPGFAFSMMPVIEKVYKNEEDKKEAYRRHTELFLTEARLSHFVIGVTAAMEERNANEHDIDPVSINAIKAALMGPLAGIGDSLYHGTLRPIIAGLAVSMVIASGYSSMVGPLLFVLVMAGVGQLLRYFGIFKGYEKGVEFVGAMQSSGLIDKMTRLAGIAAYAVIGGFVYKFVTINVPWTYKAGGKPSVHSGWDRPGHSSAFVYASDAVADGQEENESGSSDAGYHAGRYCRICGWNFRIVKE